MLMIIKEFPSYSVNEYGVVLNTTTKVVKKATIGKNGYKYVTLYNKGFTQKLYVHRLLGIYFIPNPKRKRTINHKNGNKLDNCLSNLEWATDKENLTHALQTGLRKPRSRKLKEEELTKIYQEFLIVIKVSITSLAKEHYVSLTQLSIWLKDYALRHNKLIEYNKALTDKKQYRALNRKPRQPQRLSKTS